VGSLISTVESIQTLKKISLEEETVIALSLAFCCAMFVQPYAVFNKEIEIMGALVSLQRPLCFF
jgi:hypothetical protein